MTCFIRSQNSWVLFLYLTPFSSSVFCVMNSAARSVLTRPRPALPPAGERTRAASRLCWVASDWKEDFKTG